MIDYTDWSECSDGFRRKEGFVAQAPIGTGEPCPVPIPNIEEGKFAGKQSLRVRVIADGRNDLKINALILCRSFAKWRKNVSFLNSFESL